MKRQKTYETQKLTQSIFVHIKKYMKYLSTVIIKTISFFKKRENYTRIYRNMLMLNTFKNTDWRDAARADLDIVYIHMVRTKLK